MKRIAAILSLFLLTIVSYAQTADSAYQQALAEIEAEPDPVRMEKMYQELEKKSPGRQPALLFFTMAHKFAEKGDTRKMLEYCNKIDSANRRSVYWLAVQALAPSNPKDAEPLLKELVIFNKAELPTVPAAKMRAATSNYYALAATYTKCLLANSKAEEAYSYISMLMKEVGSTSPRLQETYLLTLLQTKHYAEALPLMEEAIRSVTASAEVKAKLREAYAGVKGSVTGFESYEKQLYREADDRIVEEVLKQAITLPAAGFALKDVDGNVVTLSALKGKVVVLDFWATWCGPCKISFPSMQKALNKYKEDPDVKFFFIHTMDKTPGDPATEARNYVTENNYTFKVLMDLRDKQTQKSPVAESYNVKGIPTKIVIGPDGQVCFKVTGFNGNNETAVKELTAMIEYAKSRSR